MTANDMNPSQQQSSGGAGENQNNQQSSGDSSRLTVADILSSMANGEVVTPGTFATMEGFSTGIPTRTTPTLTPTTLRNIEQTFIELQSVPPPLQHQHQAGFVPPIVHTSSSSSAPHNITIKEEPMWYSPPRHSSSSKMSSSSNSSCGSVSNHNPAPRKGTGRMGGRRPNRDEKLSPEEEERRRVRRERNKMAAARCRKRRMDHTNTLLVETEGLEDKKHDLQKEIHELQAQKEELEFLLDAHRCLCKNRKLAGGGNGGSGTGNVMSNNNGSRGNLDHHQKSSGGQQQQHNYVVTTASSIPPTTYANENDYSPKPLARPTSLPIMNNTFNIPMSTCAASNMRVTTSVSVAEMVGIPISTPSTGMFNFDAMMDGGTGLTPIASSGSIMTPMVPTCSSQQRSSSSDLSSPDTMNGPKLVSL